ncbi:MAG: ISKra4 family transposase [Sedimentisphaerales bacterium]
MDNKIIAELEATYSEEWTLVQDDLGALEEAVKVKMQQLGQGLLQRLVDRGANGYKGSSIACKCGGSMKFIQHRSKDIHTLFGWIKAKRAYYHCPNCGESLVPYDRVSGLGSEQLSAGLAKACSLMAVDDSFEQSSRKIEAITGQKVSDNTIERVVCQVGSVAQEQQNQQLQGFFDDKQIPQSQSRPERLYVAVDGTGVHETDGWHECKTGIIYFEDNCRRRKNCYVGRFDNSETFGWHMWLEACRCGYREAQEVVFLGDAAPWIRNERRRHFGRSTFIIDWYHASEHVWDCGKALFGEGAKATEKWVHQRLDLLWDGWTKKLLDDLKEQCKKHRGAKRDAISALIRYVSTNEEQMRYDVFREKGYDIGSGAVEGACKNVVGKRLKQSGMIWSRLGSSATLALRVSWLNKRWDKLWSQKPLAA